MSEFVQVAIEMEQIDELLKNQYKIESIIENLDGAQVVFENEKHQTILNISTADARKYLAVRLQEQLKKQPQK